VNAAIEGEPVQGGHKVLYIDMAYTHATVLRKMHQNFFETRHSGGLFEQVWGVHPLADRAGSSARSIQTYAFSPKQIIIEGVSSSRSWPRFLQPLDLVLSQIALVRRLIKVIRSERIELVVATDPVYSGLLGLILKRCAGTPLAVGIYANYDLAWETFRTLAMPRLIPSYRLQTFISERVLRGADLVVGGSQDNLNWGIKHGANPHVAAVIPIARNIQACHLTEPAHRPGAAETFATLGIPEGREYLLMVSRLIPVKFAEDGVKAMIHAASQDERVVGVIAGEGPLRPSLEAMVAEAGLTGRILFLGHIEQDVLSLIIPHCVTVSPLTGMALVEAGLGGSPAVAYDADWQAEFVRDGENGYIVPMWDYRQLGQRALELIQNPSLRARMSRTMREIARHRADRDQIAKIELAVFSRVLAAANHQPSAAAWRLKPGP
jgi:glycosyltransferase involved in cell wall biosynthesis